MSTSMLGSVMPRRLTSLLIAALFGLTLAVTPVSPPKADAAVPAVVAYSALRVAATQTGVPYRYGGTRPWTGFDCSGLTMYSFARVHKSLPRTAQQQYQATIRVAPQSRRAGDLVFFYSGRSVYHVGIYAGGGYLYHAPRAGKRVSKVKIWTSHVLYGRVR